MPAYLSLPLMTVALPIYAGAPLPNLRRLSTYIEYGSYAVLACYVSLFLHEGGHYLVLQAIDVDHIEMNLGLLGGRVTWGTPYSRLLTGIEYQSFSLAGFLVMRLTAGAIGFFLDRAQGESRLIRFLASDYLLNRMAVLHGWQQGLFQDNDLSGSADALSGQSHRLKVVILGAFGAIVLLDIYSARKRIRKNTFRALGMRARLFDHTVR